jgi:hypothetical protein
MHNVELAELFFITQFMKGLKLEISVVVQSQVPKTMERAILLARIQQQVIDKGKTKWQRASTSNKQPLDLQKGEAKLGNQISTLWRERQVRDQRRANGLCYFCVEPYDANHKSVCTKKPNQQAQVNALVLNSLDVQLTDEVLNQLAIEGALTNDFYNMSLNAISGTNKGEVMQVRALVNNKVMLILIDSGSSHNFFSESFVEAVQMKALPAVPRRVKLANGEIMITNHWEPKLEWWANGYTLQTNMRVLHLEAYDAILGYDWLKAHSPMKCHWEERTMEFED